MEESRIDLLQTCFSGCDTTMFFDGKQVDTMSVKIGKSTMEAVFPVASGMEKFLYSDSEMEFHLVSQNEQGKMGLISGTCCIRDFKVIVSIDELNIEATTYFGSTLTKILGHWSRSEAEQEEIRALYEKLRGKTNE